MVVPISARNHGSNIVHTKGPDVCKTPMGSSMVDVPYMSMVDLDRAIRTSKTVRNNTMLDFQLNSRALMVTGHEPGIGRGSKIAGYKGYAHAKHASKTVYSEGWAVVRDRDPAWINHPDPNPPEPSRRISEANEPLLTAAIGTPANSQV